MALVVLSPLLGVATGGRIQDHAFFGASSVTSFEATLGANETSHNTTVYVPINGSAHISSASVNVSGRPVMTFVNLSGRGTGLGNGEEYGAGSHGGGDYNNDGYDDLVLGAFAENAPGLQPRVDVYWGSPAGLLGTTPNWTYIGINGSGLGYALAHGDYNHDGIDDLVVGESSFSGTSHNETVFLFYGSGAGLPSTPDASLQLNTAVHYSFGYSIAGGLDLDNDTYDDLVVAEPFNLSLTSAGDVWVFWGGASGISNASKTLVTGFTTVKRLAAPVSFSQGLILDAFGDTDGDGFDEFGAGTPAAAASNGGAQAFEGAANRTITQTWAYNHTSNAYFGWSIAGGRDVSGDGIADIVVGAPVETASNGAAYVFNGGANATYAAGPTTTLTPINTATQDQFGAAVDTFPDFDGDLKNELLVGANLANTQDGRAYLYRSYLLDTGAATVLRPSVGSQEQMGFVVGDGGDLNGDGLREFTVQLRAGDNVTSPGVVRLYYGAPTPTNLRVFVNQTLVASPAAPIGANRTISGFGAALDAYLSAHRTDLDGSGNVRIPVSFNFSGGGTLNVSTIQVIYSLVLPPPNVAAFAPANGSSIRISWNLQATDGNQYSVWSNKSGSFAIIANLSFPRTFYDDTNVTDGTRYWYYLTETDTSVPVTSAPSIAVTAVPADINAPARPLNFTIAKNATAHQITVQWSLNTDDTVTYEVWRRDGDTAPFVLVANVTPPTGTYADSGLAEEVNYTYQVRAVDDVGLFSLYTPQLTERIPDLTPPATPAGFTAVTHPSGIAALLSFTPNGGDTVAYLVMRAPSSSGPFVEVGRATTAPFTSTGLTRNQTFFFHLVALDKADLRSAPTATIAVLTVDTLAPDSPVVTGAYALPSGNTIQINWTASGDDLAEFRVYTDATGAWAFAVSVGAASHLAAVPNLTDGQSFSFRVTAVDRGNLEGVPSNVVSATPRDTQRPGPPIGVSVTAPAEGASLQVVWTTPADNDVAGYTLFILDPTVSADFRFVANVTGATTYRVSGLSNGISYRFQVSAYDEVPNVSPPSAFASGTPEDSIPPSPPVITTASVSTTTVNLRIAGTCEPNMNIEIWVRGSLQSTEVADATGNWSGQARLVTGDNEVFAIAVDPSTIVTPSAKRSDNSQTIHYSLDTQKPTALTTTPAPGATNVAPGAAVIITFSEELRVGSAQIRLFDASGAEVQGTFQYDAVNRTARFTPAAPLTASTTYRAQVNATDMAGNPMAPTTVSFSTAAAGGGNTGSTPGFEGVQAALAVALLGCILIARARRGNRR